jgi:hypothetical protein
MRARLLCGVAGAAALFAVGTLSPSLAGAAQLSAHGQFIHPSLNSSTSSNWFGYNAGALERHTLFHSITGVWTVPTATQHTAGQAEDSADWIGIGGGCVNTGCTVTDSTLIQTGTEQNVAANGTASYSAWWELVPAPSISVSMKVQPGDEMRASIVEKVANSDVWKITLQDVTRGEKFTKTVPYTSTHGTAEWIEETPLEIGTNPGLAALPNLTSPVFDQGTVNGKPANLKSSEAVQLADSNGDIIGSVSAPDPDLDGFNACTWSTTCSAPSTS